MQNITLDLKSSNQKTLDLGALHSKLEQLTDPRSPHGKVYPLSFVLLLIILAKFAGQQKPLAIAEWIKGRQSALCQLLGFSRNRVPCLNTIRTILSDVISWPELEKLLTEYLLTEYGGHSSELIAVDGKTLRGTIPVGETQGVHVLAAYLPEEGITLAQIPVAEKKNEISMAPQLLEKIDLKGRVVCADALLTQRTISTDILGRGGHYIWFLKENQPTVMVDAAQFFQPARKAPGWHAIPLTYQTARSVDKGHGRLEIRHLRVTTDHNQFVDWPGLSQVFELTRIRTDLNRQITTKEVVYGITSCPASSHAADKLLEMIRLYWGIENGLHHRRDVTLHEDRTRMSKKDLAVTVATLNNFIIGLFKKLEFNNLASAIRRFDAALTALFSISDR